MTNILDLITQLSDLHRVDDEIYENLDMLRDYCCKLRTLIIGCLMINVGLLLGIILLSYKISDLK